MISKLAFYLTAFLAGFITLSLEILGVRALAPFFGYSTYVFGVLVGLILLALAAGYALGGYWSSWSPKRFSSLVLLGGLYITIGAASYSSILESLASLNIVPGALAAALILFAFPMIVFGAVAPYLVARLAERGYTSGKAAGIISALGTGGSLFGTFLTSFVLLPDLGTRNTFFVNATIGILVPALWLVRLKLKPALAVLFVPAILFGLPSHKRPSTIYATESAYAHLEVVDFKDFIALLADRRSGDAYSVMPSTRTWDNRFMLYNLFAIPPLLNDGRESLLLGLGAGTLPLIHEQLNPGLRITGVEIDPKVIEIGKKYFDLDKRTNIKEVRAEDVRPFLRKDQNSYDLVEIDIFKNSNEIPFYLATKELFAATADRLTDNGLLAMNIYDLGEKRELLSAITSAISSEYPYVIEVPVPPGSFFVMAAKKELDLSKLDLVTDPRLKTTLDYFKKNARRIYPDPSLAMTDDKAPIERLTHNAH